MKACPSIGQNPKYMGDFWGSQGFLLAWDL
jgi:hypothetical protein